MGGIVQRTHSVVSPFTKFPIDIDLGSRISPADGRKPVARPTEIPRDCLRRSWTAMRFPRFKAFDECHRLVHMYIRC